MLPKHKSHNETQTEIQTVPQIETQTMSQNIIKSVSHGGTQTEIIKPKKKI